MASSDKATIVPYKVKMGDTLQRIALRITGDSENWLDIAIYNALDPPFIVEYKDIQGSKKSEGYVVFYMDDAPVSDIAIPRGTLVATSEKEFFGGSGAYQYIYETIKEVVLTPSSYQEVKVKASALEAGDEYNIFSGRIAVIQDDSLVAAGVKVKNDDAFISGKTLKVASPGDIISIPVGVDVSTQTSIQQDAILNEKDWQNRLLGSDSALINDVYAVVSIAEVANDFYVTPSGDIEVIQGTNNLAQAVTHRLTTGRGELLKHPEYGSLFPKMVGRPGVTGTAKILSLEAKTTLSQEPRILSVQSVSVLQVSGGAFYINAEVKVLGREDPLELNMIMPPKP